MAITDIDWGTVTLTNGSTAVTGTGTSFIADDLRDGDTFVFVSGGDGFQQPIVESVQSNTALTLREPWLGPTLSATTYTLRYQWDSSRVSAMSRRLIMLLDNGNLTAFSQLTGPGIAVFDGPHSMEVRPFSDFVNGVRFDVQVDTLADRAAYDGQTQGFTVLVSDMGDGRSAVFTKNSNTSADWSDAAYITGPVGPLPNVEATVTQLPPGSTATVTEVPITGGVRLDFALPEASGFNNKGVYSAAVAYVRDDVVRHNSSSFIALQAVPAGTNPSSAFPPVDTAFWQVLAAKGADGTGTGDVVGPSGAVADRIAVFDGTTGKLIKDGGVTIAQLTPADGSITNAKLANVPTATIKGRVAAGAGVPTDLTATQVLTLLKTAGAYAKDNIIGTVSQTGGVPTGEIFERDNNANGSYVKFADGTMICTHSAPADTTVTALSGSVYRTGSTSWTFPAIFAANPSISFTETAGIGQCWGGLGTTGTTVSSTSFSIFNGEAKAVVPTASLLAIGRWF